MKANRFFRNLLCPLSLGLIVGAMLSPLSPAWANGNEATDLVAPYGHLDMAAGSATGPLTTHYLISNTVGTTSTVNVKCFNDTLDRVGLAAGTTITLTAYEMEVWSPVTLGLTSDPFDTGLGFCYFAVTDASPDDIAVSFLVGISENNNLITSNDAVAITADTAQSHVTDDDANIPYWTEEGSWDTYVLLVSPKTGSADVDLDVYDAAGNLLGTWTGVATPGLEPRDLDMASIVGEVPAAAGGYGHADVGLHTGPPPAGFGYMGWVIGLNNTSLQAFMYPMPLDRDDSTHEDGAGPLGAADRP